MNLQLNAAVLLAVDLFAVPRVLPTACLGMARLATTERCRLICILLGLGLQNKSLCFHWGDHHHMVHHVAIEWRESKEKATAWRVCVHGCVVSVWVVGVRASCSVTSGQGSPSVTWTTG